MKRNSIDIKRASVITIGRQGEHLAMQVVFDCSDLQKHYGDGRAELLHSLPDGTIYPVYVVRDGTKVLWNVSASDTKLAGRGQCELRWYVNDTLAKTAVYTTNIVASLQGDISPEPPEPYQSWVDNVLETAHKIIVDISGKQDEIPDLEDIRRGAASGLTALQDESDPTVPEWAKQPTKPTYTAEEVGALPADTYIPKDYILPTDVVRDDRYVHTDNNYDSISKSKVDAIPEDPKYTDTIYNDTPLLNRISDIENKESYWDAKAEPSDIPTKMSQLEQDIKTGKIDKISVNGTELPITDKSVNVIIPQNLSEYNNDSGFITANYHDESKQDNITDLETIRTNAQSGANAAEQISDIRKDMEGFVHYNEYKEKVTEIDEQTTQLKESLRDKIDKPSTAPEVGKILKVTAINDDGTFTCEWANATVSKVTDVKINSTSIVYDGEANIMPGNGLTFYNKRYIGVSGDYSRDAPGVGVISNRNFDKAVRSAMCDPAGIGKYSQSLLWTDSERISALLRMGCTVDDNGFVKWTAQGVAE